VQQISLLPSCLKGGAARDALPEYETPANNLVWV